MTWPARSNSFRHSISPWRRRTGFTESANFNISFPPPGIFSQNKSLLILREGLKDKVRMVEMSMNRFAHIEKLTGSIRISESNSNEELHQNNSLEMNQRLILIFKFDTEFIEPIKRKHQELEIQNADTNCTKSFINKSKDRYYWNS